MNLEVRPQPAYRVVTAPCRSGLTWIYYRCATLPESRNVEPAPLVSFHASAEGSVTFDSYLPWPPNAALASEIVARNSENVPPSHSLPR
jgi:hypothetical protein